MKNSVTLYAMAFLASGAVSAQAQQSAKDSTLNRELLLEKEYNPIVRDADKINKLPEVEAPKGNKTQIQYSDLSIQASPSAEANTLSAGEILTNYAFSKQRGYLNFTGGNYLNLNGDFGYRFVDNNKAVFGIEFTHNSTNGTVDYVDTDADTKLKINNNLGNLYYRQYIGNFLLKTRLGYNYDRYNNYGWSYPFSEYSYSVVEKEKEMNTRNRINFQIGGESASVSEWMFNTRFGVNLFKDDITELNETAVDLGFGMSKEMSDTWRAGGDLSLQMLIYGDQDAIPAPFSKNAGLIGVTPYITYDNGDNIRVKIGVNADFAYGLSPKLGISPDIHFDAKVADGFFLYTDLTGGLEQISMSDASRSERYYNLMDQSQNSYTLLDATLGLRSNKVAGFWFDLYAGYAYTKDARFYMSNIQSDLYSIENDVFKRGSNTLGLFNADASVWKAGVNLKYQYGTIFEGEIKLQKNGWSLKEDQVASYKPGFEAGLALTIRPLEQLVFNLDYNLYGQRKYVANFTTMVRLPGEEYKKDPAAPQGVLSGDLDAINDLSLKATYVINKTFAVTAGAYNLTMQKYDLWYGMPAQGFNFQVGGSIRF